MFVLNRDFLHYYGACTESRVFWRRVFGEENPAPTMDSVNKALALMIEDFENQSHTKREAKYKSWFRIYTYVESLLDYVGRHATGYNLITDWQRHEINDEVYSLYMSLPMENCVDAKRGTALAVRHIRKLMNKINKKLERDRLRNQSNNESTNAEA